MDCFDYKIDKKENGLLTLDLKNSRANILKEKVLASLDKKFDQLIEDSPKRLIIKSAKENIFIAGADIAEIKDITNEKEACKKVALGQQIIDKITKISCPTIAVINGACLGGGLELALACDYRICTDSSKVQLGLPEVKLGIIPGFGGTQRLPKLIGFTKAFDLISTGKSLDAKKAYKIGLVDFVYPSEYSFQFDLFLEKTLGNKRKRFSLLDRLLKISFLRNQFCHFAKQRVKK